MKPCARTRARGSYVPFQSYVPNFGVAFPEDLYLWVGSEMKISEIRILLMALYRYIVVLRAKIGRYTRDLNFVR